jgi:hypothetical protein
MDEQRDAPTPDAPPPPPRAFTQGVGTVFQFVGVILFLVMMFICCGSSLLSKDFATHTNLNDVGWHISNNTIYSAQRATTISVIIGVFLGIAVAGIGLGLQAQNRRSPIGATILTSFGTIFWIIHTVFFADVLHSVLLTLFCGLFSILFAILFVLSVGSLREMRRDPPPMGQEVLPEGYIIPYSHLHQDPPEVRLALELDQRRERLAVQQKELEMLEEKLRKKLDREDKEQT